MDSEDLTMEGLIDLLAKYVQRQFSNEISTVIFGELPGLQPRYFQNAKGEWRCLLCIVPISDRLIPNSSTHATEDRLLSVDLVLMVNLTPYVEALPPEGLGERMLVRTTQKLRAYFAQSANFTLGRRVSRVKVDDVEYATITKKDSFICAAGIRLEVTSTQNKLLI